MSSMSLPAPSPETVRSPETLTYPDLWRDAGELVMHLPGVHFTSLALNVGCDPGPDANRSLRAKVQWTGDPTDELLNRSVTASITINAREETELGADIFRSMGAPEYTLGAFSLSNDLYGLGIVDRAPERADAELVQKVLAGCLTRADAMFYKERCRRTADETAAQNPPKEVQRRVSSTGWDFEGSIQTMAAFNLKLALASGRDVERHSEAWRVSQLPISRSNWPAGFPKMAPSMPKQYRMLITRDVDGLTTHTYSSGDYYEEGIFSLEYPFQCRCHTDPRSSTRRSESEEDLEDPIDSGPLQE